MTRCSVTLCSTNKVLLQFVMFVAAWFPTVLVKKWKLIRISWNENHGQWKRYQRPIANISITPVITPVVDNSCYRNACNMSLISFSLAVVFITRLVSTSTFRVPNLLKKQKNWFLPNVWLFGHNVSTRHARKTIKSSKDSDYSLIFTKNLIQKIGSCG